MMRDKLFLPVVMAATLQVSCGPANQYAPPPAPAVTVLTVEPAEVETRDAFSGRIAATESVEVRARVKGFLERIHFRAGQIVERGDVLFTIERDLYQAALEAAQGQLDRAKAELALAQTTFDRQKQLRESETISELEFLQSGAQLDEKKALVKQAEAALNSARLDLEYTTITAPVKGRTSRELVTVGNLVGSGENTLLTTIVSDDPVHAYFTIDERQVLEYLRENGRRKEGDKGPEVGLELVDGTLYGQTGRVNFADNRIAEGTGTLELRAEFPNPDSLLVPGVFGRVLFSQAVEGALVVPLETLQRDLSGTYLMVVGEGDVARQRYVETGAEVDGGIIVADGLDAGERVVMEGLQRVRPGMQVKVEKVDGGGTGGGDAGAAPEDGERSGDGEQAEDAS